MILRTRGSRYDGVGFGGECEVTNAPCSRGETQRFGETQFGMFVLAQRGFHLRDGLRLPGNDTEVLECFPKAAAVRADGAIVVEAQEKVRCIAASEFREEQAREKWRAVDLLKRSLQCGRERVVREAAQRDIIRRARETFRARQFDGREPQPLEIAGMPDAAERDAIIDFKNLLPLPAECEKQDTLAIPSRYPSATMGLPGAS